MNAYLKKKTTLREKRRRLKRLIFSASFRAVLLVFIFVFSFLYVWQTNVIATKGYEISDLEGNIKELEIENRRLEVKIAEHTSMNSIQDRLGNSELVPVDHVTYLTLTDSVVAQR